MPQSVYVPDSESRGTRSQNSCRPRRHMPHQTGGLHALPISNRPMKVVGRIRRTHPETVRLEPTVGTPRTSASPPLGASCSVRVIVLAPARRSGHMNALLGDRTHPTAGRTYRLPAFTPASGLPRWCHARSRTRRHCPAPRVDCRSAGRRTRVFPRRGHHSSSCALWCASRSMRALSRCGRPTGPADF